MRRSGAAPVPSLTAYILFCCARIVAEQPILHAYKDLRNRLVVFPDVDVSVPVERKVGDSLQVVPTIIRAANKKSVYEISQEIIAHTHNSVDQSHHLKQIQWFVLIPRFLRRMFFSVIGCMPSLIRNGFGTVLVTSVGMFGRGAGWPIPLCTHTFNVAIGGVVRRPVMIRDTVTEHQFLCLTVSVDHDIVDGAPAARCIHRLRRMIERAEGLTAEEPDG